MVSTTFYAGFLPHVAALLAYLGGLVVAIILLARVKGRAAILATVGFGLLTLIALGQIVLALPQLSREFFRVQWLAWALNCCCSVLDIGAIVCLIIAIWQAVTGAGAGETAQEAVYPAEIVEEAPEEAEYATVKLEEEPQEPTSGTAELEDAPRDTPYATKVLEETLEGEVIEDTAQDSPYATRALDETEE
jgi:hypothetical protein